MPQQMGRRVVRRLLRWHVPTAGHPGPALVTLATAIAIVSALIFSPGILANTPYGSLPAASSAGAGASRGITYSPADGAGTTDDLGSSLVAGTSGATPVGGGSTSPGIGWPPFGVTPVVVDVPADDVIPALLKVAVDRLAAAHKAAPRKHPKHVTVRKPVKPVKQVSAWNVAPIVTWYGPGFYGGKTACGQRYTRYIVGVASRTLPCGTLVQFSWHGISVVAPVIDRGPYASSAYVFDFSARLACDLFREHGAQNGCFTRYDVRWRVVGRR